MSQLKKNNSKRSSTKTSQQHSSSSGRNANTSVNLDQSDSETEGSPSAKRMFTTANKVSPHLSNRSIRARGIAHDELMQDLLDDRLGETEDDLLYPFPFRGMRMLNRCDYYKPA